MGSRHRIVYYYYYYYDNDDGKINCLILSRAQWNCGTPQKLMSTLMIRLFCYSLFLLLSFYRAALNAGRSHKRCVCLFVRLIVTKRKKNLFHSRLKITFSINPFLHSLPHLFRRISRIFMTISGLNCSSFLLIFFV